MSRCATEVTAPGRARSASESGVALVTVLIFLLVIASLASVLFVLSRTHSQNIDRDEQVLAALEAAQAGVVQSAFEIGRGLDLDASAGVGNVSGQVLQARYEVIATPLARRHWRLDARGTMGDVTRHLEVTIAPVATGRFRQAVAAVKNITLDSGVTTDSYDSVLGDYASQATRWDDIGRFARRNGSVASSEDLSLSGSSTRVRGDANPGPGLTITGDGYASVTGDTAPLDQALDLPEVTRSEFGDVYVTNDNLAISSLPGVSYDPTLMSVTITSGSTVTIPAGRYFFTSMTIESGAQLIISGTTEMYLVGHLDAADGRISTQSGDPRDLSIIAHPYSNLPLIHVAPVPQTLNLSGSSDTAMTIYAPGARVNVLGGSDFFGAVIGKRVRMQDGVALHYDEALGYESSPTFQPFIAVAWKDRDPIHGFPQLAWAPHF